MLPMLQSAAESLSKLQCHEGSAAGRVELKGRRFTKNHDRRKNMPHLHLATTQVDHTRFFGGYCEKLTNNWGDCN